VGECCTGTDNTKTDIIVVVARIVPIADSRAAIDGIIVPRTATQSD